MALDVCEVFRFKFFDGRVQWVHDPHHSRTARAPEVRFNLNIEEGRPAAGCAIMLGHDSIGSEDRTDNLLRRCDSGRDLRIAVSVDAGKGT